MLSLCPYRHGQEGQSYIHVIQACRLVWNMSSTAVSTPKGRVSLVPLLLELLDILSSLSGRRRKSVMRFMTYPKSLINLHHYYCSLFNYQVTYISGSQCYLIVSYIILANAYNRVLSLFTIWLTVYNINLSWEAFHNVGYYSSDYQIVFLIDSVM